MGHRRTESKEDLAKSPYPPRKPSQAVACAKKSASHPIRQRRERHFQFFSAHLENSLPSDNPDRAIVVVNESRYRLPKRYWKPQTSGRRAICS
jgi:hypothetical protein